MATTIIYATTAKYVYRMTSNDLAIIAALRASVQFSALFAIFSCIATTLEIFRYRILILLGF